MPGSVDSWPFQSTRPVRGGTADDPRGLLAYVISIHPPRAGRDGADFSRSGKPIFISIHPPRAGRDGAITTALAVNGISIHPPRAGRDC